MTAKKTTSTTKTDTNRTERTPEELRLACEIHALAQSIYGRLATTHPWVAGFTPNVFSEPKHWPPAPAFDAGWGEPWPWTR